MKRLQTKASLLGIGMILWIAVLSGNALGQATFTAQLRGTIEDASKAAVPRVTVTATNNATNVSETVTTDDQGRYIFNTLRPASYTLKVEAQGFKTVVQPNVVLRVGQQMDLDISLEVGEVTSTVEVTEAPPLLNSVSAALGQEVDNRYVTEVPLLDRQILNLAFLAPGVTEVGGGLFGNSAQISGVNFVSNGQRTSTAEVRLDGGLVTGPELGGGGVNTVSYQPPIEVVQEFKVQNNSFSAEYGGNGGTVISVVTKSGTNEFHGSGYWFGRRPQLDANNFFANRDGQKKADFKRDQYGGSVGGPIFRQKTFFFFDFEKIRDASPSTITTTVPTDLHKRGDFSQTFNPDGTLQQIFNPFDIYTDAEGNLRRRPFSGNVIPSNLISPLAQSLMSFYPDPTSAGDPITGLNNFTNSFTIANPAYSYDIKIDQVFSEKSRLSGRYSRYYGESGGAQFFGNPADPNPSGGLGSNSLNNFVLEHTWTLSPTTVWTNRFGVERQYSPRRTPEFDPTSAGFPPVLSEVNGRGTFPRIDVESYSSLGQFGWTDTTAARTQFIGASSLSKVVGPHNLKFGVEQITSFVNFWQPGYPSGYFSFGRLATMEEIFNPNPNQGNGLASLLLDFGDPFGWNGINIQPGTAAKSKQTGLFIQDDWRVTQRLTLNLGLRYEWSSPFTERFDRTGISDFNADAGVDVAGVGGYEV